MMGTSEKQKTGVKPYLLKALLAAVFVFGLTIFVHSTDVQAATKVTNVAQTKYSAIAVQINYNAGVDDFMYYRISTSKTGVSTAPEQYYSGDEGYRDSNVSPYMQIGGLTAGNSYWVQVGSASVGDSDITWSDAIEVVTAPNAAPTNLKHTGSTKNSISISWNAVTGANMYTAYSLKYGSQAWSEGKNVTTNKITFTGLTQGSAYGVEVVAARKSSTGYIAYATSSTRLSNYLPTTPTKPGTPYLTSPGYKQQGSVKVAIKTPQSSVAGYQFQVYDVGTKKVVATKTTNGTYATKISSSKLKNNDVYKVRVRGYVKDSNGKKYYGTWSSYSYFASQKNANLSASRAVNGIKLSWKTVKGAKKYVVYMSTTKDAKNYKKIATTTKKSYVITKYGKASLKPGKRYYVYIAPVAKDGKSTNSNMLYVWPITY